MMKAVVAADPLLETVSTSAFFWQENWTFCTAKTEVVPGVSATKPEVVEAIRITTDHLGSVREMLDQSGNLVSRYNYDDYGRAPPGSSTNLIFGTNLSTFQYAGYYAHLPSGFDLANYRIYRPNVGLWLNRDPAGESGGLNLYGYVDNEPVNAADPDGLTAEDRITGYTDAITNQLIDAENLAAAIESGGFYTPVPHVYNSYQDKDDYCAGYNGGNFFKWFNQADIMPRKGKMATHRAKKKTPKSSFLVLHGHTEVGWLSHIHPDVSTQGPSSSKRLSSPTTAPSGFFTTGHLLIE